MLGKEERKHRFVELRAKGYNYTKIAKELKVSTSTLSNWNQELLEEIAQAKAVESEALQEKVHSLECDDGFNLKKMLNARELLMNNSVCDISECIKATYIDWRLSAE